jgi:hypothetical protein
MELAKMTSDAEAGNLERDTFLDSRSGWMAAVEADPRYSRFSVDQAQATFTSAGFARVAKEHYAWGDTLPGTDWPCACFERNRVTVVGHRLAYEVFAPGDGSPMACFPDAELAIRFVRAFEQEPELMTADRFSDEQFNRVQTLAAQVFDEALREVEETRKRLRDWAGLEDEEDGAASAAASTAAAEQDQGLARP